MIVVGASNNAPFSSFREMLIYAKGNPGKISYGTSGLGTSHHLALEQINLLAGVDITHIPYKGGDQVITDVIAGRIQASSSPLFSAGVAAPMIACPPAISWPSSGNCTRKVS